MPISEMLRWGIDLYGREGARRRAATTSYDDELRRRATTTSYDDELRRRADRTPKEQDLRDYIAHARDREFDATRAEAFGELETRSRHSSGRRSWRRYCSEERR